MNRRDTMDIKKWKSVAVRVKDYDVLKALCDKTYRSPAAMIGMIVDQHVAAEAKKEKISIDKYKKNLLNS